MAFRNSFPEEGLYWTYKGHAEFVKHASNHLRKFVHEYAAGRKSGRISTSMSKGSISFPAELLQLLELGQGDQLELRVMNNKIVSGIRSPQDRLFDPVSRNRFIGLNSSAVGLTTAELKSTLGKSRRNG